MDFPSMRRTFRGTAAAISVTASCLVLLELVSWGVLRWRARRELAVADPLATLSPYRATAWAAAYWREMKLVQRAPEYYPYVVWRRAPFAGSTITIDERGLRRTVSSSCDAPGAFTIDMFGGSTLWGHGAPDWGTIPSYLAEEFVKQGRTVCVRNHGEFGWVATQGLLQLVLDLKSGRRPPDQGVAYDGCNDVLTPLQSGRVDVHGNFQAIKAWHDAHRERTAGGFGWLTATNTGALAARLADRLGAGRSGWQTGAQVEPLARRIADDYLAGLDLLAALGARYGFRHAAFLQPIGLLGGKALTAEERSRIDPARDARHGPLAALYERTYALLREARRDDLHDATDVFRDEQASVYLDICHVAPAGNRLVARRMYEVLGATDAAAEDAALRAAPRTPD